MPRYDRIRYKRHARRRMAQRKISEAQVRRAINEPDREGESRGKLVAETDTGAGNTVFVYYVEAGEDEALVISVKRRSREQ